MRGYSVDLRERAVAAVVAEGLSQVEAAKRFGVSRASVGCYVRAFRAGASLAPDKSRGRPRLLRLPEHMEALREHLQAEPDMELAERCEHLAQSEGVALSVSTLWRAMRALDWTREKRRSPPLSRTR
jgi:transposase